MKTIKILFLEQEKDEKGIGFIKEDERGKLVAEAKKGKVRKQIEKLIKLILGKPLLIRKEKEVDLGDGISERGTILEEVNPGHPEFFEVVVRRLGYYSIDGHRIYGVIEKKEK